MGIGNKPCLDITPSRDQICDRSISLQQLNKGLLLFILAFIFAMNISNTDFGN